MPPSEGQWRQIGYKCPSTYQWPAHLKIWVQKGNLMMIDDENRILCHHLGVSYTRHLRFDLSVKMRNSTILQSFLNIFTWKSQREHKERDRPGKPDPPIDLWIIIEFWLIGVYRGRSIGRMIEFKHWAWTYIVNVDLIVAFFKIKFWFWWYQDLFNQRASQATTIHMMEGTITVITCYHR